MAQITDVHGREYAALIAAESLTVQDPLTGTFRKLIAGEVVPGGLEDVYRAALAQRAKPRPRREAPKK